MLDDLLMDTIDLHPHPHQPRLVEAIGVDARPRSSLLVLAGVIVANVGAVVTVAAGTTHLVVMALGFSVFVGGSAIALRFAGPGSASAGVDEVGSSAQLGLDPERRSDGKPAPGSDNPASRFQQTGTMGRPQAR